MILRHLVGFMSCNLDLFVPLVDLIGSMAVHKAPFLSVSLPESLRVSQSRTLKFHKCILICSHPSQHLNLLWFMHATFMGSRATFYDVGLCLQPFACFSVCLVGCLLCMSLLHLHKNEKLFDLLLKEAKRPKDIEDIIIIIVERK